VFAAGQARRAPGGLLQAEPGADAGPAAPLGAALIERSTGVILLGPPKSTAGRRIVGIPQAIMPVLSEHLSVFVKDEPGAVIFPGAKGGPLRLGNFNRMSGEAPKLLPWPRTEDLEMPLSRSLAGAGSLIDCRLPAPSHMGAQDRVRLAACQEEEAYH
jgi:hypothetical protein